jgi:hypothetical protein
MADAFRKEYLKRWIAYFTLCCVVFAFQQPSRLMAQDCRPCVLVDQEDACRTRTATIVAGATILALVGGVAYIALGSGHKCHSHSSSSSSSCSPSSYSYCYSPCYSSYSYDSYGHHHHHHHNHHHHSHSYSSRSSDYYGDDFFIDSEALNNRNLTSDPQLLASEVRSRQLPRNKKSKETHQISGVFTTHPSLSATTKGSVTAFVQMPDGTTQVLGSIPFSASAGSSLAYGPFTQEGNYLFGIRIDEGSILSSQTKVGSVEVHVDGSTVESRDFFAPAHSPSHYEPKPCEYSL